MAAVPTQGVAPLGVDSAPTGHWTTELFGCFEDISNCFMTFLCPCVTFGQIAEIVDRGSTSCGSSAALYSCLLCVTCCPWIYSCGYRSKLRAQYGIPGNSRTDCFIHCCLEYCALCQEYRELQNRKYDMSLGWHGNVQKQQQLQANGGAQQAAPPMQGGMVR